MSDNRNWTNLGEQILDSVTDAISTGDFTGVKELVTETVNSAVQEAKYQAFREKEQQREKVQKQYFQWQDAREERERRDMERREMFRQEQEKRREELLRRQEQWHRERREHSVHEARAKQAARTPAQVMRDMRAMVKTKRVGSVSGVLFTVFGSIGVSAACFGIVWGLFALLFFGAAGALQTLFWGAVIGAVSGVLLNRGIRQRARLNRFERYIQLCGYKMYGMVEDLAKSTGKSIQYVRRDLKKMLKLGFFPEGHLDDEESCFMLNDTVYNQYRQTAAAYREAEEARLMEEAAKKAGTSGEQAEGQSAGESELSAMVAEGMEYTRRLRVLNDEIPGEPISAKLYQLENLLKEIFDRIKDHPEQMHRMHKLMEYYLPTTLKLVEAYKEFSEVSAPGPDILSAMAEIEKTLDTINEAFKALLNELFQDAALDVTTDAQVLQSMLAREGLTRELEPFAVPNNMSEESVTMIQNQ